MYPLWPARRAVQVKTGLKARAGHQRSGGVPRWPSREAATTLTTLSRNGPRTARHGIIAGVERYLAEFLVGELDLALSCCSDVPLLFQRVRMILNNDSSVFTL